MRVAQVVAGLILLSQKGESESRRMVGRRLR
jgi:hypothetical protein